MDAYQYCAEYGRETRTGRILFTKIQVDNFISTYTNLEPKIFTKIMRAKLKAFMIDCYNNNEYIPVNDLPAEKIQLPDYITN